MTAGVQFSAWTMSLTTLLTELETRFGYSKLHTGLMYLPQGLCCLVASFGTARRSMSTTSSASCGRATAALTGPCQLGLLGFAPCVLCGWGLCFSAGRCRAPATWRLRWSERVFVARKRLYHRHCHHDDGGLPENGSAATQRGQL